MWPQNTGSLSRIDDFSCRSSEKLMPGIYRDVHVGVASFSTGWSRSLREQKIEAVNPNWRVTHSASLPIEKESFQVMPSICCLVIYLNSTHNS